MQNLEYFLISQRITCSHQRLRSPPLDREGTVCYRPGAHCCSGPVALVRGF